MVTVTFTNAAALLFLVGIPIMIVVHIISYRFAKGRSMAFANFEAMRRATSERSRSLGVLRLSRNISLLIFRLIIFSIIIIALSGITIWGEGEASTQDFVLLLDASGSMLARDIEPTRFDAAKTSAIGFVESLSGDSEVGLVSFAGIAFLEHRLTDDRASVVETIGTLDIRPISGTDIAAAIIVGTNEALSSQEGRTLILLTDGRQTTGTPLADAIRYAQTNYVTVHTIGFGTQEGGAFLEGDLLSSIDIVVLEQIAESTGGRSFIATSADELDEIYGSVVEISTTQIPYRLANTLMLIAIGLLFIEWGLLNTKFRSLP